MVIEKIFAFLNQSGVLKSVFEKENERKRTFLNQSKDEQRGWLLLSKSGAVL